MENLSQGGGAPATPAPTGGAGTSAAPPVAPATPPAATSTPEVAAPAPGAPVPQKPQSAESRLSEMDARFDAATRESAPSADIPEAPGGQPAANPEPAVNEPSESAEGVVADTVTGDLDEDPLAEFERRPPTREEIDTKFARVPKAARDEIAHWAEKAATAQEFHDAVGGEHGINLAKSILPHLMNPAPTPEVVDQVMDAIVGENPKMVEGMGQALINAALNADYHNESFATRLLTEEFGEAYNLDRVRALIEFDKAKLINFDELKEDFETSRTLKSPEVEALERKVAELEARTNQDTSREAQAKQEARAALNARVDQNTRSTVNDALTPIWSKLGWMPADGDDSQTATALTRFNAFANKAINDELQSSSEWLAIEALKEQNRALDKDGNPTAQYTVKLQALKNRAQTLVVAYARELQPVFANGFKSTRRAKLAGNGTGATPATAAAGAAPATAPVEQPSTKRTVQEALKEIDGRFDQAVEDERVRESLGR